MTPAEHLGLCLNTLHYWGEGPLRRLCWTEGRRTKRNDSINFPSLFWNSFSFIIISNFISTGYVLSGNWKIGQNEPEKKLLKTTSNNRREWKEMTSDSGCPVQGHNRKVRETREKRVRVKLRYLASSQGVLLVGSCPGPTRARALRKRILYSIWFLFRCNGSNAAASTEKHKKKRQGGTIFLRLYFFEMIPKT